MKNKMRWILFSLYLAVLGSYCGLEIDTLVEDLPFFQISTLILFTNVLFDVLGQNVKIYGLEKDPEEKSPEVGAPDNYLHLIRDFYRDAGN